jgi:hypothetical protein
LFAAGNAKMLTLSNLGETDLTVSAVKTTGDFSAVTNCKVVAPGKSCAIDVIFKPTARGERTGIFTIEDNATTRIQTARLTGTGIGPDITFSSSKLVFPGIPVSVTSQPQTLTVNNLGEAELRMSYKVTGPFAVTGNCGPSLGAGKNCALRVAFKPTMAGSASGSIIFTDNAAASPQTVRLSGTAGTPAIFISPTSLIFPETTTGTGKVTDPIFAGNLGTAYLTVTGISLEGPFTQTNNCTGNIPRPEYCSITVAYDASKAGTAAGWLMLTDTDPRKTQTVPISATTVTTHTVPTLASADPQIMVAGSRDTLIGITGTNFFSDTVLEWNGTKLATTSLSPTYLYATVPASLLQSTGKASIDLVNSAPGGGTSGPLTTYIVSRISVSARDMVWDPVSQLIYVSTATNSLSHPNQVISLNPATGEFGKVLLSGNEPGKLAITPDAKYLYIETDKSSAVTRIDLATGSADLQFSLDDGAGSQVALDMVPAPGDDSSVAIAIGGPGQPSSYSVQEFKDGNPQPTSFNRRSDPFLADVDCLLFLDSAHSLYGGDTEDSGADLTVFSINSNGLSLDKTFAGIGGQLATDGKNIFVGSGLVISPINFTTIATLPFNNTISSLRGWVTVDPAAHEAFFGASSLGDPDVWPGELYFVDTDTFEVLGSIPFNEPLDPTDNGVDHIIRYGPHGIAFRSSTSTLTANGLGSSGDAIILLETSLAKSP